MVMDISTTFLNETLISDRKNFESHNYEHLKTLIMIVLTQKTNQK